MKHRFLIHCLSHTIWFVDITEIFLPAEVYPPNGEPHPMNSLRFHTRHAGQKYLLGLGRPNGHSTAAESLKKAGVALPSLADR
jgi:hypothetical protein